ncbi:MAG: dTMP kinase [Gammaproteobacteria bacterium]|nr:dTMP kinase [Gammaproteobacteria bacterium]
MKGLFITIEGIEGAGKSTVIQFLYETLQKQPQPVVLTREPGGTEIAEKIRTILLNHHDEKMAEDTELLLFFAARAQHIAQVIKPALKAGKIILCDRFTDASYAYQCGGRNIPEERIEILENWVQGNLRPDLTVLLDVDPKIGLGRIKGRPDQPDRFEMEKLQFFDRVRACYLDRAKRFKDQYRVIDASGSLEHTKEQLRKLIKRELDIN